MPDPITPPPASPTASAPKSKTIVQDVTPPQSRVHKIVVPAEEVPDLLAKIDPSALPGKGARSLQIQLGPKGELIISITYQP
jgi:hypothetical protein